MQARLAKFRLGQRVRHRVFPLRGVVFDVDPQFSPPQEARSGPFVAGAPAEDQPFYHLVAEGEEGSFTAYVCERNLVADDLDAASGLADAALATPRDGAGRLRAITTH